MGKLTSEPLLRMELVLKFSCFVLNRSLDILGNLYFLWSLLWFTIGVKREQNNLTPIAWRDEMSILDEHF